MNVETTELKAVAQVTKSDDLELLALSLDDLDLVGGGVIAGYLG
jgi:hypothetical protein